MVERVLIRPPSSQLGPLSAEEKQAMIAASPVAGIFENVIDRNSAYKTLEARAAEAAKAAAKVEDAEEEQAPMGGRKFNTSRRYSDARVRAVVPSDEVTASGRPLPNQWPIQRASARDQPLSGAFSVGCSKGIKEVRFSVA